MNNHPLHQSGMKVKGKPHQPSQKASNNKSSKKNMVNSESFSAVSNYNITSHQANNSFSMGQSNNNMMFNSKLNTPVQDAFYNYSAGINSDKNSKHRDSFNVDVTPNNNVDVTPKQNISSQMFSPGWYYRFSPKMMADTLTPTGLHGYGNSNM